MMRLPTLVISLGLLQAATAGPMELGKLSSASTKAEETKDYATAIRHMKDYAHQGGEPFYAALRLGWLHYNNADYSAALRYYTQATALQPGAINARLGLLNTAVALKDARRTAEAAAALIKADPNNYQAHMALAGLHAARRDHREAATTYARILASYPDDPDALSGAAWSALRIGDKAAARSRFETLLGRDPAYPKAGEGFQLAGS